MNIFDWKGEGSEADWSPVDSDSLSWLSCLASRSNAMTFYPSESKGYKAGRSLRKTFVDICKELGLVIRHAPCVGDWPYDYTMLVKRLMKHKDAAAFLRAVDPKGDECPDYPSIIR